MCVRCESDDASAAIELSSVVRAHLVNIRNEIVASTVHQYLRQNIYENLPYNALGEFDAFWFAGCSR